MSNQGALAPRLPDPARIPPALLLGLGGGALASIAAFALHAHAARHFLDDGGDLLIARASLTDQGLAVAIATLLVAGLADLRRRLPGAQLGLVIAGAIGLLGASLSHLLYAYWILPGKTDLEGVLIGMRWVGRIDVTAAVAFAAGLCFLGAGSHRGRAMTVPLLLLAVVSHPPLMITEWIGRAFHSDFGSDRVWLFAGFSAVAQVGFAGLALAMLKAGLRDAQAASAPWYVAARGFHHIGAALNARIAIVLSGSLFLLLGAGAHSAGLVQLWMFATPAAILATGIVQVVAMVSAAELEIADTPRLRLYVGVAATVWSMVVVAAQALVHYQIVRDHAPPHGRELVEVLTVAGPVVGLAGLLCLVSSISSIAAHLRGTVTPARATRASVVLVAATAAAVALQHWIVDSVRGGDMPSEGTMILVSLLIAAGNVAALLAVARLSQQLAADLHAACDAPAVLPRAELRE